ncbi:MAG: hypothetical protein IJW30_03655 [Clostridia bacterium]|nr:hypothetical protein [Clostridia bacterium]
MKERKGLWIAILCVLVVIAGLLLWNGIQGGVWIIEGLNGTDGKNGVDGADGADGAHGKSAYELAVEDGFSGSLHDWLLSLAIKGDTGATGATGAAGADGADGIDGIGVQDVRISTKGHLLVTLTNGVVLDAGYVGTEREGLGDVDGEGFVGLYEMVTVERCAALNLRTGPASTYEIVAAVPAGSILLRIGENKSLGSVGWSRLIYASGGEQVTCYASSYYLDLQYEYGGELPDVILPERLVVALGDALELVNVQIVPYLPSDMRVQYSYTGSGTRVYTDAGLMLTPDAVGTQTLCVTLELWDCDGWRVAYEQTVAVEVVEPAGDALQKTGLLLGDGHLANAAYLAALSDACPALRLIGTRTAGELLHEGRDGWGVADYLTRTTDNPFYNPTTATFDFAYYMREQGYDTVDFVVISLGEADGYARDAASELATLVDSILAYDSETELLILSPALASDENYRLQAAGDLNVGQVRAEQLLFGKALARALGGREESGVWLLSDHLSVNGSTDRVCADGVVVELYRLSDAGYAKRARALAAYLGYLYAGE